MIKTIFDKKAQKIYIYIYNIFVTTNCNVAIIQASEKNNQFKSD